jgi:hypothetical protein
MGFFGMGLPLIQGAQDQRSEHPAWGLLLLASASDAETKTKKEGKEDESKSDRLGSAERSQP